MNKQFREYLSALSSTEFAPGGGSASCYIAMLAASTGAKCINITMARKSFNSFNEEIKEKFNHLSSLTKRILDDYEILENADQVSFKNYMNVRKESEDKVDLALMECIEVSEHIFKLNYVLLGSLQELHDYIATSMESDYSLAIMLFIACMLNACKNFLANYECLKSEKLKEDLKEFYEVATKFVENN